MAFMTFAVSPSLYFAMLDRVQSFGRNFHGNFIKSRNFAQKTAEIGLISIESWKNTLHIHCKLKYIDIIDGIIICILQYARLFHVSCTRAKVKLSSFTSK